jgi:hypothetical protein
VLSLLHIFFFSFFCLFGALAQSGCWGYKTILLLLFEDGFPMPSPKTWRARVTLLDWHHFKSLLGCIRVLHAKEGAVFLFAKCLHVGWLEYALFREMVCCNLKKIIF